MTRSELTDLNEDSIEENTVTASVSGTAEPVNMVRKQFADTDVSHVTKIEEGKSRYRNLRSSETYKKQSSKVSFITLEIKKMMREINFLAQIATRLKTDEGISSSEYWNRTITDLEQICQLSKEMSKTLKDLRR